MWHVLGSSSSRSVPRLLGRRLQRAKVNNLEFRTMSGAGGDGPEESQIYTNLFGDDKDHMVQRDDGGHRAPSRPPRQTRKEVEEAKRKPKLQLADIPEPLWTDSLEISDERWQSKMEFDDIPDWSPDFVSRVSKERVQLFPGMIFFNSRRGLFQYSAR